MGSGKGHPGKLINGNKAGAVGGGQMLVLNNSNFPPLLLFCIPLGPAPLL